MCLPKTATIYKLFDNEVLFFYKSLNPYSNIFLTYHILEQIILVELSGVPIKRMKAINEWYFTALERFPTLQAMKNRLNWEH